VPNTAENTHSPFTRKEVIEITNSVIAMVQTNEENTRIYNELNNLIKYIKDAKADLSALNPGEINDKHIPDATDELDAVVGATEEATGSIMDACDAIQAADGDATMVNDEIMKIYEACSFQDITGQRITKVVSTLKNIEDKVDNLLNEIQNAGCVQNAKTEPTGTEETKEKDLLNGPQLPGQGVSQDEIDALLAGFD